MKKHKILLALVITITFLGGFFTGIIVSNHNQQTKTLKIDPAPKSAIKPKEKETPKAEQQKSKVLIGYVQDFRNPDVVDYANLTHVIFSFAYPTKDGGILLKDDSALANLRAMVAKAKPFHTKVILGVGGWFNVKGGEAYDYFNTAISSPVSRTKLVSEITSLVDREHLDGVDVDFEFPRSAVESQNLAAFTNELSAQLHPEKKELSVAVYSKIYAAAGTVVDSIIYDPAMFQNVDHVNIMAYDGQWDGKYNAANLSPYPFTEKSVTYWSNLFDSNHLPKDKLVLGVPLYAQPENPSIKQVSFSTIVNQNPANAESDTVSMNGTIYHYNGAATMKKKTKLALDNGFGGMMMWEEGHDAKGSYSLTGTIAKALEDSPRQYALKDNKK